jgi:hypothetical protein
MLAMIDDEMPRLAKVGRLKGSDNRNGEIQREASLIETPLVNV